MKNGGKQLSIQVVEDTRGTTLKPIIDKQVDKENSIIITDEWLGYSRLKEDYTHVIINHLQGEYARCAFDNNAIEGVWSQLKGTIKGTHIHVSKRHLQKHAGEVAFRYIHREEQGTMFETILQNVV